MLHAIGWHGNSALDSVISGHPNRGLIAVCSVASYIALSSKNRNSGLHFVTEELELSLLVALLSCPPCRTSFSWETKII